MTDKELLTLAAKAAGGFVYVENMGWIEQDEHGNRGSWWNPFGDDGDALRLAVKIGLRVMVNKNTGMTSIFTDGFSLHETYDNEPYAATRRAIVRAAAEIGRAM